MGFYGAEPIRKDWLFCLDIYYMKNIKGYHQYIVESGGDLTWIVMTKRGQIILNTKDEEEAKKVLAKPASDLTELETAGLGAYRKIIGDHEAWEALRAESRLKLAALGGAAVHVDAKQTWEQDDL